MKIPTNCLFSEILVNFVMGMTFLPLSFLDSRERQQLSDCKEHLCLMRLGARKIIDPVFGKDHQNSSNSKLLFDYFFNIQHTQTTLPLLGEDSYQFDNTITIEEQFNFMKWVKSLCLNDMKSQLFTLLLTNSNYIYKSLSTMVVVRKTDSFGGYMISTCECSITLPSVWFVLDHKEFSEKMDMMLLEYKKEVDVDENIDMLFNIM